MIRQVGGARQVRDCRWETERQHRKWSIAYRGTVLTVCDCLNKVVKKANIVLGKLCQLTTVLLVTLLDCDKQPDREDSAAIQASVATQPYPLIPCMDLKT